MLDPAGLRLPRASRPRASIAALLGVVALLNVVIGVELAQGRKPVAIFVALLPLVALVVGRLSAGQREVLPFVALGLTMVGGSLNNPLPGTGGAAIYPADILLALAVGSAVVARLTRPAAERGRLPRSVVLGWPFAVFAVLVLAAIVRGHLSYGIPYLSQPVRLLLYAAIASSLAGLSPQRAYRNVVVVFYGTILFQALVGTYHLATGTSQTSTSSAELSTGGTRALALTTGMYLSIALVVCLLNLDRDGTLKRRVLHLAFAALAVYGIVLSLSRTSFIAAAVLVPIFFLTMRRLRASVLGLVPLLVPVVALIVLLVVQAAPQLGHALTDRLSGAPLSDASVVTRQREWHATLEGFSKHPLVGFGFGRRVEFLRFDGIVATIDGDPENSYIWLLASGGALTLTAFLALVVSYFVDGIRRMLRARGDARRLVIFAMSFVFVVLVNAITFPMLSSAPNLLALWIALLLPAVVAAQEPEGSGRNAPTTIRSSERPRVSSVPT